MVKRVGHRLRDSHLRLEKSSSVTVEGSMPRLSRHVAARGYSPTGSDSISDEKRVRKDPEKVYKHDISDFKTVGYC